MASKNPKHEIQNQVIDFLQTNNQLSQVELEDSLLELECVNNFYLCHASEQARVVNWCVLSGQVNFLQLAFDKLQPLIFTYVSQSSLEFLFTHIDNAKFVGLFAKLESDDAVSVLEDLEIDYRLKLISLLPSGLRVKYNRLMSYKEGTVGRIMNVDFPSVSLSFTARETLDYLKAFHDRVPSGATADDITDIVVTDENDRFCGFLSLSELVVLSQEESIAKVIDASVKSVLPNESQKNIAKLFADYGYSCVPVVNRFNKVVGIVDSLAISDFLEEEAELQILRAKGIFSPKNIDDGKVTSAIKSRSLWLFINLLTAIMSSFFISFFEDEISKLAPLAVLMPIVASMGGNAANQSATVTVRFIGSAAFKGIYMRQFRLEFIVASINGLIFAAIGFLIAIAWYKSLILGIVLAISMIFALFAAGIFGFLIPMFIMHFKFAKIDPAVASTVILTTITDIIGFAGFLLLSRLFNV